MEGTYDSWRLAAQSPLPTWAIALVVAAALASVLLAWRGLRGEPRRARKAALVALRAVAAAVAVFLALEPAVELLQTARVRNRLAVLLDASRSMNFPVEPGGPSRAEAAAEALARGRAALGRLADRVDVEWSTFGQELSPLDPAELAKGPLASKAGRTDLVGALEAAAAGSGSSRKLAGVLVVSDGADNAELAEGLSPAAKARIEALGVPVNTASTGRSAPRDLAVERVAVDDFAFVRNSLTAEVTLRARGFGSEDVKLVLRREGAVVSTANVKLEPGRDRYTVPIPFAPDQTGTFVFTVAAPVFPGEAVVENNQRSFVLRVIRDRVRVLLVAGRPSWDVRFLRSVLKQDPNVDLVSFYILRSTSDDPGPQQDLSLIPFPVQEIFGEQLRTFDAIIFANFAYAPYRSMGIERYLPGIRDYVKGGGALAMVGGELSFADGQYGDTPLAEVLPVELVNGLPMREGEARPRLTPEGRRHPLVRLAASEGQNEALWAALPPITAVNLTRPLAASAGASVLLEAPEALVGGRPAPVVAIREVGQGRSLAVATDASWRWGFQAAELGQGNRAYLRFWNAALRWLVRDPGLSPLQVEPDAPAVEPGAPVGLTVAVRGPDFGPRAGKRVTAELVSEDGKSVARGEAVAGDDGNARIELQPPGPGAYKVNARSEDGQEVATAAVAVRGAGPEDADAAPRPELLSAIAAATGGNAAALPGDLPDLRLADPEVVEIGRRRSVPIWDRGGWLALLAGLLTAEWLLRRRWGYA
ncbi:MAG: glutamine amidotransferase [Anaeromyxobacteraceae bacterium]